jgi:hypothetical protein
LTDPVVPYSVEVIEVGLLCRPIYSIPMIGSHRPKLLAYAEYRGKRLLVWSRKGGSRSGRSGDVLLFAALGSKLLNLGRQADAE